MLTALALVSLLLLPPKTVDVVVVTLSRGDVSVALQPSGRADLKREATITRISVELEKLQPPSTYAAGLNCYVVWAVSPEGDIENVGEVAVEKDKGRLETTTRFEQAGLFITAEPDYMVDRPSSEVIFRSQNPRNDQVRRQTVTVEVGTYDYSWLVPNTLAAVPPLLAEARAAFAIAQNAGAERLAEAEFRRARAALDTMEQLVSRASPADIIAQSAHETIRRSQQAVIAAREKQAVDLKLRLPDLQSRLVLPLRNEFYNSAARSLTPDGREALARLSGLAEAVPGQIRLEGPAPDALFEAVRQYLIQSGVPQDRIVIRR